MGAALLALGLSPACGSEDSARKSNPSQPDEAGAGGQGDGSGGMSSAAPTGGTAATVGGAAGSAEPDGGAPPATGGSGDTSEAGAAAAGAPSLAGAAGSAGASSDCDTLEPVALTGVWSSNCNGYTCRAYFTESGAFGAGCTNGQYETGTLADGKLNTTGEGGPYAAYSTKGTLTRLGCDTLKRDYIGQMPPNTGPEQSYSCQMTRGPDCGSTLLETLAGVWNGKCNGNSTCVTTITAEGTMTSTCSNGQASAGSVEETGAFADMGGGGNSADYSTSGVLALSSCDTFSMPYTWQSPPHQGTKHWSQCTYTRKVE